MANYSRQREEIIKIIKELENYPNAEQIYFLAKKRDPAVSRSTIYRNLTRLVANHTITQISISGGPDRYEYTNGKEKHGYALCVKCGNIYSFNHDFEKLKNEVYGQTGIEIFENGIVIKGICTSCKEASNNI